jgi:hypothetical protein
MDANGLPRTVAALCASFSQSGFTVQHARRRRGSAQSMTATHYLDQGGTPQPVGPEVGSPARIQRPDHI